MSEVISSEETIKIIEGIVYDIEKEVDYLTSLDQAIGDGDHGINLAKGLRAVLRNLNEMIGKDVGVILRDTGLILISQTGGTVGPLYGTAFIRAGDVVKGKTAVDVHDIAQMFEAAEQGIMEVGGSKPGEKTMLDAIHPATLEMKKAVQCDKALIIAFESCVEAAEAGMKATINMVSKCGRSRYLGERSRGHQDVGATSVYLVLKSALHTLATLRHFHK